MKGLSAVSAAFDVHFGPRPKVLNALRYVCSTLSADIKATRGHVRFGPKDDSHRSKGQLYSMTSAA
jgi:hypothetical protein